MQKFTQLLEARTFGSLRSLSYTARSHSATTLYAIAPLTAHYLAVLPHFRQKMHKLSAAEYIAQ